MLPSNFQLATPSKLGGTHIDFLSTKENFIPHPENKLLIEGIGLGFGQQPVLGQPHLKKITIYS